MNESNCTIDGLIHSIRIIKLILPIVALLSCIGAISLFLYYQFYRSFNYRLILYLLLSHVVHAIINCLQLFYIWEVVEVPSDIGSDGFCLSLALMKVYCMWNVELTTAVMIVEVFLMIMFSYELQNEELVLLSICFYFPMIAAIIPLGTNYYGSDRFHSCGFTILNDCDYSLTEIIEDYIFGMIVAMICIVMITTAMCSLVYHYVTLRFTDRAPDEDDPMRKQAKRKYLAAFKQTLPFAMYPILSFVSFVMYCIHLMAPTATTFDFISLIVSGSVGTLSATVFFIHVYLLGSTRRNVFKYHRRGFKSVATINEEQRFATEGSMTWTHFTRTEMPPETCIESQ